MAPVSKAARRRRRRRSRRRARRALQLLVASLVAVAVVAGALQAFGEEQPMRSASNGKPAVPQHGVRVPSGPIPGFLLIADRGNNRILLVDNRKRVVWSYPPRRGPVYPFHFDDDAFFGPGFTTIVSNQEDQHTIQILGFPNGRLLWRYGHPNRRGSSPGYLNTPDDAYQLANGLVSVADAYNCRVLFLDRAHAVVRELGRAGTCVHAPPRELGTVNGATPLPGGGTLVSEIKGSWVDAFARNGRLMWDFQAPVSYPSDPQWLGNGRILLADYARPGHVVILNSRGRVLWRYGPSSGQGMLDHPSLAMRIRPGLIAVNDDYRDRVVLIDVRRRRVVWQYGHTDVKGTAAGYLNAPDGMDLLPPARALALPAFRRLLQDTVVHRQHRELSADSLLRVRLAPFRLPAPVQRAVAVAWRGRILIAGGLDVSGQSAAGVFALDPATGKLRGLGALPLPFHDAAGALIGGRLIVFGGGASTSSDAVQAFDPRTRHSSIVARLPRPLSDLASAQLGGSTYLVGGFDGRVARTEILATRDGRHFTLVARLPVGLRYPAVAAVRGKIVVAGGETSAGLSSAVYAVDPASGHLVRIARLPAPLAHAAAVAEGRTLYVLGGTDAGGRTSNRVTAVNPSAGSQRTFTSPVVRIADAASARLGRTTFLIGGRRNAAVRTVLEIRPR